MTVQTISRPDTLRTALKTNAAFSLLSGLALTFASGPIAAYMGFDRPVIFLVVGIFLLIFAADVWYVATRPKIDSRWAQAIFWGDVLWVVGTAVILITGIAGFNTAGRWLFLIVADIVAALAFWQGWGIWKAK